VRTPAWLLCTSLFAIVWLGKPIAASACEQTDAAIRDLARQGQVQAAERMAKKKLDESPDSIEAHISLASVYVDWATREEVGVDTEALDLAPGETGTRMLTPEIANRAFRGEVRLDLVMAQRATELLEEIVRRWPDHWESHLCLLELHQLGGQREALLAAIRRTARQFEAGGSETVDRLLRFGR
jgi:hypothetical protein